LSPYKKLFYQIGTPRYPNVVHRSIIWSTEILAAVTSDPKAAVSTELVFWNTNQLKFVYTDEEFRSQIYQSIYHDKEHICICDGRHNVS
jgi:hypothetical protein